jgi:prepilin-type N-terminal cleavage/methylation domain-containing protein
VSAPRRGGFTLVELVVALVLAGVVALLVYGVAAAGADTQQRLRQRGLAVQQARAFRATLADALRNARPTLIRGDTAFNLEVRRDGAGRPRDRIAFVTAGAFPPLTADADWAVTVEPSPQGVLLEAVPLGVAAPAPVLLRLPGVTGLDVRVLGASRPREWTKRWAFPSLVPPGVELTFWTDSGPGADPPVRLMLPLGGVE